MKTRELNKLKKQKADIVNKNYDKLSEKMQIKLLNKLKNIDNQINKLK